MNFHSREIIYFKIFSSNLFSSLSLSPRIVIELGSMFEKKETGFRKWCALSSLRWSDVMFETILYFFSTDVCEISGQRTGSQRRRRRREVGRLFDWTITPRQKSSPSVNPFHSCLLFFFSLFSHPPLSSNGKIRANNLTKFSGIFFLNFGIS